MNLDKDTNAVPQDLSNPDNRHADIQAATHNPYQAPQTTTQPPSLAGVASYYIVSKKKFFILFFMTFSLYSIYWFYKNWKTWKDANNESIWPVPRAIFNIFFTHSLFKKIHNNAVQVSNVPLKALGTVATVYVFTQVMISITNSAFSDTYLAESMIFIILGMALTSWCLWQAQNQANIACLDETGSRNNKLTGLNILFIVLGVIMWLMALLGIVADLMGLA